MQGSLFIPLRGSITQLAVTRGEVLINARHPEGHNLGLSSFPLDRWTRKELTDEERESAGGLAHLETPAPLVWIGSSPEGGVWWVDESGGVGYEEADAPKPNALKPRVKLGSKRAPVSLEGAMMCADDERLMILAPKEGAWALTEVKRTPKKATASELWSGSLSDASAVESGDESSVISVTSALMGPGVSCWGLSDGRVALWFDAIQRTDEGASTKGETWSPLFTHPHTDAVRALACVHAEDKDYLITYGDDLKLAQTRLDDLEPMPRAANGKGLHESTPLTVIPGPLGRFYSVGRDGVRAWPNAYSNVRPAGHEEVSEEIADEMADAVIVEVPVQDLEGAWAPQPMLMVAGGQKLCVYALNNPSAADEEARGESLDSERGRLGEVTWRAEGARAWLNARLSRDEVDVRSETLKAIKRWGDETALSAFERVAGRDDSSKLRASALKAIIKSDHPAAIHALGRLLGAEHSRTACDALDALREVYGADSLYPIREAIKLGGAGVTRHALEALGALGARAHEAARSELKAQLAHDNPELAEVARAQLELCYAAPRGVLIGLGSTHDAVRTMALHRLLELGVTGDPIVSGRLQQLREDESREVRRYALAVSMLGHPTLSDALRADDALLHEELNKVQARTLEGEARAAQLSAATPSPTSTLELDSRSRQLLFEISASGREDVAVHGPVALAQTGDLRALPALLALSRADDDEVRLRATRGLVSLAATGERRARAQLQSLTDDAESAVRLIAYRGLKPLFDEALDYAEFGLTAAQHDVRLTALTALQDAPRYQSGLDPASDTPLDERASDVLALALTRHDDLELAREARKIYLRDVIGGSIASALSLILRSVHEEVRALALADLVSALRGELSTSSESAGGSGGGGGDVSGKSFVFTGTLERMTRADAQKRVKELGGTAASGVTAKLDYLVVGDKGKAGSKLTKANNLGVRVLSETEFWGMIEGGSVDSSADSSVDSNADSDADSDASSSASADLSVGDDALAQLSAILFADPASSMRLEALKALVGDAQAEAQRKNGLKGELQGERALITIDAALAARARDVRLGAISALELSSTPEAAHQRLRALLSDSDARVARAALQVALRLAEDDLGALVEEGLGFEDDGLRTLAVKAAAGASQKLSWREDLLIRAISDGVAEIRELAFEALRAHEMVNVAARLLDHALSDVRDRAALTLARAGDERALAVALEALATPAPNPDEVIAAQEASGGEFGLLDDLQWKRQVTLALSAQQRAFAAASASAHAQASADDDSAEEMSSESGSESGSHSSSEAGASAAGVAYAEQSLSALISVNDQVEGAVERAARQWRARISAALRIVREGRFEGAFDAVWAHYQSRDAELSAEALLTLPSCVGSENHELIKETLRADIGSQPLAWALIYLNDSRGLNALSSGANSGAHDGSASAQTRVEAALTLGGSSAERALALEVARGGDAAQAALYAEVLKLIYIGGDCPLIAAGLSSERDAWRRVSAEWVASAHSHDALTAKWGEEMTARRAQSDLDWEQEMARFEAGELKKKPKGRKPHWITDDDWRALVELSLHPEARARHFAASALFELPSDSASAERWCGELHRQRALADACWSRRADADQAAHPQPKLPASPTLALSEAEGQALAFGTYASLVSASGDVESLDALSALFHTDPVGGRALIQMSLRVDGSLQRRALELLESCAEALELDDVGRADLLISTDQPTCVQRGAQLLARVDAERARSLITSDDGEAASSAAEVLLELEPASGLDLLALCMRSPNPTLRSDAARRWVGLLRVWPKSNKALNEDDAKAMKATQLNALDLKVLRAVSADVERDAALERLMTHLTGDADALASSDVQLTIAERLRAERVLTKREQNALVAPLKRLLASTEPEVYKRALGALRDSDAKGAAEAIWARLEDDPTRTADVSLTLQALSALRDSKVVEALLDAMEREHRAGDDQKIDTDDIARCVLEISGHDDAIDEVDVWDEMSEDERKEEEKRARQDDTLGALIIRCAQLGLYDFIGWELDLLDAAQTARSGAVDEALIKLTQLPRSSEADEQRVEALSKIVWRVRHRGFDPKPLAGLVTHRDLETRVGAAEALAYGGHSEGVRLLIGVARDRHERYDLRERSVNALGASGDLRAVQTLLALFDDHEDCLRSEALEALSAMRDSEVADEILSRLINALEEYSFVDTAISGLRSFDHPDGWSAMRLKLKRAQSSDSVNESIAEALQDDTSPEIPALLERAVVEGDLYDDDTRTAAYRSWLAWRARDLKVDVNETQVALEPAVTLFKTDLTSEDLWSEAVEVILERGYAALWVELAFDAQRLSSSHQKVVSKFESRLRELKPAPLDHLLPRLADAISDAPNLARMTLSLVGADPESLSEREREQLLSATSDVRERWLELEAERKAGARDDQLKVTADLWAQLLWLWGRASGGAAALWGALSVEDAPLKIYREALFSLEARLEVEGDALEVGDQLISSPAASVPELSPIMTRIATRAGLGEAALGDDRAESLGGLTLGDWDALRAAPAEESAPALLVAARRGDALALSALIGRGDETSVVSLLGDLGSGSLSALTPEAQREIARSSARLASASVESALVDLAKATADADLSREAWRARRRSARRRSTQSSAQS